VTSLRPFFSYFGGKWRSAPKYPPPTHAAIIEPFAGSAGYSLRYAHLDVTLIEKSHVIAGVWRYLLGASQRDVLALPLVPVGAHVDEFSWPCPEARDLVGLCINRGCDGPRRTATAWGVARPFDGWTEQMRHRVAEQLGGIRHWKIIEGEYTLAPDVAATWFIDPPYASVDKYRWGARHLSFPDLARWCIARRGQVMVCEAQGADWLPFFPFGHFRRNQNKGGARHESTFAEALWLNDYPGAALFAPPGTGAA